MQDKKIYLVGGAVRDIMMGLKPVDRDYVCVGYTHEDMMALGFEQVGASFPVYLHPETKEEYALARKESSTGPGHKDFSVEFGPDVTIEEDLYRRDLTINAMALDEENDVVVDPYGGREDLMMKVLRIVNPHAFIDDPLRVYRILRFYARYGGKFEIHRETAGELHFAVVSGGLDDLPKERKFAEIVKCFSYRSGANKPSLMMAYLASIGELPELENLKEIPQPVAHHPEGDAYTHTLLCMDYAYGCYATPEVQWATMCHDFGKVCWNKFGNLHGHEEYGEEFVISACDRFGVPVFWKQLAVLSCVNHTRLHRIFELKPKTVLDLVERLKGEHHPTHFLMKFIEVCIADARGRGPTKIDCAYFQPHMLMAAVEVLQACKPYISENSKAIAEKHKGRPDLIKTEIRSMKARFVKRALDVRRKQIAEVSQGWEPGEPLPMYRLTYAGGIYE